MVTLTCPVLPDTTRCFSGVLWHPEAESLIHQSQRNTLFDAATEFFFQLQCTVMSAACIPANTVTSLLFSRVLDTGSSNAVSGYETAYQVDISSNSLSPCQLLSLVMPIWKTTSSSARNYRPCFREKPAKTLVFY
jgi:hypothetical protein